MCVVVAIAAEEDEYALHFPPMKSQLTVNPFSHITELLYAPAQKSSSHLLWLKKEEIEEERESLAYYDRLQDFTVQCYSASLL